MDRRRFLSTSLVALTAPVFGASSTAAVPSSPPLDTPAALGAERFAEARFRSLLGSRFQFTGDAWRGGLQLTDVVARSSDARVEQFATVFKSMGPVYPAPGLYTVDHPEMGRFALRIDGPRESSQRQATFALLRG
jgi:hypothetical protein